MGSKDQSILMFKDVLEKSKNVHHYIRVLVLRMYGYLLVQNEETKHEGEDYIE